MVLKRANISKVQRMLVLSKMDLEDTDKLYENMCRELKVVAKNSPATTTEEMEIPAEEVLAAHGYFKNSTGGGGGWGR